MGPEKIAPAKAEMIAMTVNNLKFLLINFNNDLKVKSLLINIFGLKLRQMYENKKAYDKPLGRKLQGSLSTLILIRMEFLKYIVIEIFLNAPSIKHEKNVETLFH